MEDIKKEFDKYTLYPNIIKTNLIEIEKLKEELFVKDKPIDNKDPFDFLKKTEEINLIKKNIQVLHNKNKNINDEIIKIPDNVRKYLCNALHEYFDKQSALDIKRKLDQEKYLNRVNKIYKVISILATSTILCFIYSKILRKK
jgi:hypothetical protein